MPTKHELFLHIKSLLTSPAKYLSTWRSYITHKNQFARWKNVDSHDNEWSERTHLISSWISPRSSALEFDCGREHLIQYLAENCTYQPSDIAERSEHTLFCDLNQEFPSSQQKSDTIAFSGVSEYIYDLEQLLTNACRHFIMTYTCTDMVECITTRLRNGWSDYYIKSSIHEMIEPTEFRIIDTNRWRFQTLYHLQ